MSVVLISVLLLPILSGLLLFRLRTFSERAARAVALGSTVLTSLGVGALILYGEGTSVTLLHFSGLLSLSLSVDGLGRFFAGMMAFLWPFALLYTFVYLKQDEKRVRYYAFFVMTYGVVLGIPFSDNALTLYIFYELLTFITLPLITHTETKEARKAGRLYLYYSLSGSSLALAGIVMQTVASGMNVFFPGGWIPEDTVLSGTAFLLTFLGFGVKAALFPLCRWLPAASAAPTPTTALLHAVAVVKSGAFAIMRMTFFFFSPALIRGSAFQYTAIGLAALTVLYGSCMALREMHFKRRFAFSTVSNLSYILLGVLLATPEGLEGALMHFLMHSLTKIGVFFCIGALMETNGITYVFELNGMGKKAPWIFACFTVSGLSLIGIPPFACFLSKFYLLRGAVLAGGVAGYLGAGAVLLSALLTAIYVLSVSFRAFFREPNDLSRAFFEKAREPARGFAVLTAFFSVLSLLSGIFGDLVLGWVRNITGGLI